MDQNINFAENRVTKKVEGSYKTKRLLFRCGQALFMLLPIIIGLAVKPLMFMLWTTPVFVLLGLKLGNVLFRRFLDIEYEYAIVAGEIRVSAVYGNIRRVELEQVRFRDMNLIAPYAENKADADASDIVNRIEAASSLSAPNVHFGIYDNAKGEKTVLFFDVNEKMAEQIRRFNPTARVVWTPVDTYSDSRKKK